MSDQQQPYSGHEHAHAAFAGLTPSHGIAAAEPLVEPRGGQHALLTGRAGVMATVPLVLAGAMTMTLGVTSAHAAPAPAKRPLLPQLPTRPTAAVAASTAAKTTTVPATYTVKSGDTISGIATRYGLSTASVLTLNGLSWKSLIFPGQVLKLTSAKKPTTTSTPAKAEIARYTVRTGDTVSRIAKKFGVSTESVLKANGLSWTSLIFSGQTIVIPGVSASTTSAPAPAPAAEPAKATTTAAKYLIKPGDTITSIAKQLKVSVADLLAVNGLNASSVIYAGRTLLIPGEPEELDAEEVSSVTKTSTTSYTIAAGDTLSGIAKRFGVSLQALLTANGLNASSVIFAGRTLVIPIVAAAADGLTSEQVANAQVIISVGRSLGVPERGIIIALATAAQESSLRNLTYGDRDSVGLFQQRPSAGWGEAEQLLSTTYAARLFYGGPKNPNAGVTRGLLDIPGWKSLTLTQAAQAVQISAYPNAYAKWEDDATRWLAQLG